MDINQIRHEYIYKKDTPRNLFIVSYKNKNTMYCNGHTVMNRFVKWQFTFKFYVSQNCYISQKIFYRLLATFCRSKST